MPLYPGMPVLYRWRAGQIRGGNVDAGALVLRIGRDNTVDLVIFPAGAREPLYFDGVSLMDQEHQTHCWHLPPVQSNEERMAALEQRILDLEDALTGGRTPAKKAGKVA